MATTPVTGPVLHYVAFPSNPVTAYFLGTSKQTPKIRVDRAYLPINMEQGGYVLPFDLSYQGKEIKILTQLNFYNLGCAYLMGCSPRYGASFFALGRGLDSYRDIGSLMLGNKCCFTLYLVFPFAETSNNPLPTHEQPLVRGASFSPYIMPRYYRIPACVVEYEEDENGTGAGEKTLAIHGQRIYYSRALYKQRFQNSPLAGGFFLFDHRTAGMVPPIKEELAVDDESFWSELKRGVPRAPH